MAEPAKSQSQSHLDPSASGFLTPERRPRASHETGQSSRSGGDGSRRKARSHATADVGHDQVLGSSPSHREDGGRALFKRAGSTRRIGRSRSSGGFLMRDSIPSSNTRQSSRALPQSVKSSQSPQSQSPQSSRANGKRSLRSRILSSRTSQDGTAAASASPSAGADAGDVFVHKAQKSSNSDASSPPQAYTRTSLEDVRHVDPTQIVQMALNLSESRRMASRRNVSWGTPPRLASQPDGSPGSSNMRQHSPQQRRSSYNKNYRFSEASFPRVPSGRVSSRLQTGLDEEHDYRYHFSPATLARAQKAKDHLELMSQYRRLLLVLPPIKPGMARSMTISPPESPSGNKPFNFAPGDDRLGRQYNPLQYIRNRKIRARERKVIDGEKQGFGDVECVTSWVDEVVERSASLAAQTDEAEDNKIMPPFLAAAAADPASRVLPDDNSRTTARLRRPRVDWFIEPCDIVADAYWLEQENHKELIEDRNWRKILPRSSAMSRPISREADMDPIDGIPNFGLQDDDQADAQISGISKVNTGMSHSSARERAKQTIHNLKAYPHRHTGHNLQADLTWHRKDSTTDFSGSETDNKKLSKKPTNERAENGTITPSYQGRLKDHLLDMIAREAREREFSDAVSEPEQVVSPQSLVTSEQISSSQRPSLLHSRQASSIETSDTDQKKPAFGRPSLGSPPRSMPARQSLDVPGRPREYSISHDVSLSNSPSLRPTRAETEPVVDSHALSLAWSRSGSPHRNPISKIKQMMRDRSGDEGAAEQDEGVGDRPVEPGSPEKLPSMARQGSGLAFAAGASSALNQAPSEAAKTRRRTGSLHIRSDDPLRFRGMLKGPRIDNVLRGGVSKLGDMLWKREGAASELPYDTEVTDESEVENSRGRPGPWTDVSRKPSRPRDDGRQIQTQPKHFLDTMPHFTPVRNPVPAATVATAMDFTIGSGGTQGQQQPSSWLHAPRPQGIDPRSAPSPALSDSPQRRFGDAHDFAPDADARQALAPDGAPKPGLRSPGRDGDGISPKSKQWFVADKATPNEETRLTRREVARMRALVLSTGIKAMEISRRAREERKPFRPDDSPPVSGPRSPGREYWSNVARLCPDAKDLPNLQVARHELYLVAGRSLSTAVQDSAQRWQVSADRFTSKTSAQLQDRIGDVRSRIVDDLSEQSQQASDLADETNRDLALGQPLKVKSVVDTIEKMLRRRRRRLRWLRRALWLMVEWLLVGFMWFVWFVVTIFRIVAGAGRGVVTSARWLLWL